MEPRYEHRVPLKSFKADNKLFYAVLRWVALKAVSCCRPFTQDTLVFAAHARWGVFASVLLLTSHRAAHCCPACSTWTRSSTSHRLFLGWWVWGIMSETTPRLPSHPSAKSCHSSPVQTPEGTVVYRQRLGNLDPCPASTAACLFLPFRIFERHFGATPKMFRPVDPPTTVPCLLY